MFSITPLILVVIIFLPFTTLLYIPSHQAKAQTIASNEEAQVLVDDAIRALKNKETNTALVHLTILKQQLAVLGNSSLPIQSAKVLLQDAIQALQTKDSNTTLVHLSLIKQQLAASGSGTVTSSSKKIPTVAKVGSPPTPASVTTIAQEYKNGYNTGYSDGKAGFGRGIDLNTLSFNDVKGSINYREGYQAGYRDGWTWSKSIIPRTCYDEHDIVVTCPEDLSNDTSNSTTIANDTINATTQYVNNGTNIGNNTASVPYILPSPPPAVFSTYQSGLCLHPSTDYEINVCNGFLAGLSAAKSDLQNSTSYSGSSFGTSTAYGVGYFDGYNYVWNGGNTNIESTTAGSNMTGSQDNNSLTTTSINNNITSENISPSFETTQSPQKSGVDWMNICTTVQPALYPSCDTLVNSDGTLTPDGQHAVDCIKNGALLAGGAMAAGSAYGVPVPPSLITKGLSILAAPTGCGGIVKMDQINNVVNAAGGLGTLSHLIP